MTEKASALAIFRPPPGRRLSLKIQFVILLCVAMGPAALMGMFEAYSAFERQNRKIEQNIFQSATIAALAEREVFTGAKILLATLADQDVIKDQRNPACGEILKRAADRDEDYAFLITTDAAGRPICTVNPIRFQGTLADLDWFKTLQGGDDFTVSAVTKSPISGLQTVVAAAPLRDAGGALIGAVAAAMNIATLEKRLELYKTADQTLVVLVDQNGNQVAESNAAMAPQLPPTALLTSALQSGARTFRGIGTDGQQRIYAIAPIHDHNLNVLVGSIEGGVFHPTNTMLLLAVSIPLLTWLLSIVIIWVGVERLVMRWVVYLQRVGAGYARGHYLVLPKHVEHAPAEFRELGRTLSDMALTARARQRDLRAALEQKNILVKEIHHRVKNNLQIIQSLLNLQSRSATDSNQFTALAAAKSRINALALVHQSLYEDENLEYIELQSFLNQLCRHLLQSGWGAAKRVGITVEVPEVATTADTAVPVSLLVTEAVTNALKHAFFGRDTGTILIRLVNDPEGGAELTIKDDGIGIDLAPKPQGKHQGGGIGYSLIEGFARQLRGTITTVNDGGTIVTVKFPYLAGRPDV